MNSTLLLLCNHVWIMGTLWVPGRVQYVYYVCRGVRAHMCCVSIVYGKLPLKYHVGWVIFWPNGLFAPKFSERQVPIIYCHIIRTVRYFSKNHCFVFMVYANKRTSSTMPFGYGKLKTKRKKEGLKVGHTSGWVTVPVGTENKIYWDYPITKLKILGLQRRKNWMGWMLD